jgi:hypothetical protein
MALVVAVAGVAACGPKGSASGDPAADSAATADSVTIPDSTAPRADSSARPVDPAAPLPDSAAGKAPAPAPTSAGTMAPGVGRDSAFGPKFLIDSAGRVTPVGAKKKP